MCNRPEDWERERYISREIWNLWPWVRVVDTRCSTSWLRNIRLTQKYTWEPTLTCYINRLGVRLGNDRETVRTDLVHDPTVLNYSFGTQKYLRSRRELNISPYSRGFIGEGIWKFTVVCCVRYEWLLFVSEGLEWSSCARTPVFEHHVPYPLCPSHPLHCPISCVRELSSSQSRFANITDACSGLPSYNHTEPCRLAGFHEQSQNDSGESVTQWSSHLWWTVSQRRDLCSHGRDLRKRVTSLSHRFECRLDVILLQILSRAQLDLYSIRRLRWYRVHILNLNVSIHSLHYVTS